MSDYKDPHERWKIKYPGTQFLGAQCEYEESARLRQMTEEQFQSHLGWSRALRPFGWLLFIVVLIVWSLGYAVFLGGGLIPRGR